MSYYVKLPDEVMIMVSCDICHETIPHILDIYTCPCVLGTLTHIYNIHSLWLMDPPPPPPPIPCYINTTIFDIMKYFVIYDIINNTHGNSVVVVCYQVWGIEEVQGLR